MRGDGLPGERWFKLFELLYVFRDSNFVKINLACHFVFLHFGSDDGSDDFSLFLGSDELSLLIYF